jgi:hypothetical protein
MSDEHSFSLHRASAEYPELAVKLRELARAYVFPGPRQSLLSLAVSFDLRAAHFDLPRRSRDRSVIGETLEWMLWRLVRVLIFLICFRAQGVNRLNRPRSHLLTDQGLGS